MLRYAPTVRREAYVLAAVHDLVSIPYSPARSMPHILYAAGLGRLLYLAYLIERKQLWDRLLCYLVGVSHELSAEGAEVLEELESVEVHRWEEVERFLRSTAQRVGELYEGKVGDFAGLAQKVFGFERLFETVHVVYGFNPLVGFSSGSLLYFDEARAVVSVYVNELTPESHVLDVVVHELLHGLLKLNRAGLSEALEELVVSTAAPQGYLSKMLGLAERVHFKRFEDLAGSVPYFGAVAGAEGLEEAFKAIKEYYEEGRYASATLLEWLRVRLRARL